MKLRLTEEQFKRLKNKLNEGIDGGYSRPVQISFYFSNVNIKGLEISDIERISFNLKFGIDIDARSWGIKDILVYSIVGPSEVDVDVEYLIDANRTNTETIKLSLDWSNIEIEKISGKGVIGVDETIDITLMNDAQGNLVVSKIQVTVFSL